MMKRATIMAIALTAIIITCSTINQASNTDFTLVAGISSRNDSNVHLALATNSHIYTPLHLTIASGYNCNYTIYVNGSIYHAGIINISKKAVINLDVHFSKGGYQEFKVEVGEDPYIYRVNVLNRSYESAIRENVTQELTNPIGQFFMKDLIKVFTASLVGTVIAIFLAYWWKINKIKQEPRRLL